MAQVEMDIDESSPWLPGLVRLVRDRASGQVVVHGLEDRIDGVFAELSQDGALLIERDDPDSDSGTVIWIPVERIVAVTAHYRLRDAASEHRARIQHDVELLKRVQEVTALHVRRPHDTTRHSAHEPSAAEVAHKLNIPIADVQAAFEVLSEHDEPSKVDDGL